MKKTELDRLVSEELQHIPRIDEGSDQNALRMMYNMIRRRELGRRPAAPRAESLGLAVRAVQQSDPVFSPKYDAYYFGTLTAKAHTE